MDVSCGFFMHYNLASALKNGDIGIVDIDRALTHLMTVKFNLGVFDQQLGDAGNPYSSIDGGAINSTEHQGLARSAAEQGFVLLENNPLPPPQHSSPLPPPQQTAARLVLPLQRAAIKTVAAIGPYRANGRMMQGNYAHMPGADMADATVGLQQYDGGKLNVAVANGCNPTDPDTSGFAEAENAAAASDATV